MDTQLVIRGRRITNSDIAFIRSIIEKHQVEGRTFIARELCAAFGTGGRETVCSRPWPITNCFCVWKGWGWWSFHSRRVEAEVFSEDIGLFRSPFTAVIPSSPLLEHLILWRSRWSEAPPGSHFTPVACKDQFIGWSWAHRDRNIHLIAQNNRFLILPWVQVPSLASHILGRMARIISQDWQKIYNHPLVLLETFVDTSRFQGTYYRAANWIQAGFTRGRGKWDTHRQSQASVKKVFLYPLVKNFREILTNHD